LAFGGIKEINQGQSTREAWKEPSGLRGSEQQKIQSSEAWQ
jgi:hypothetical protein